MYESTHNVKIRPRCQFLIDNDAAVVLVDFETSRLSDLRVGLDANSHDWRMSEKARVIRWLAGLTNVIGLDRVVVGQR